METNTLNKCPVCDGRGIVPNGFYNTVTGYGTTNSITPDKCRSCDGVGVIHAIPAPLHPKEKITFHIDHNPDDWEVEVKDGCYTLTRKKPTSPTVEAPKHEEEEKMVLMAELKKCNDSPKHEEEKIATEFYILFTEEDVKKCSDSPHYFMTKYYRVNGKPFTTMQSEEDFNMWIKLLTKQS